MRVITAGLLLPLASLVGLKKQRRQKKKAITIAPESFDRYVRTRVPWHRPEHHAHMLEGLRKAGWRES